MRVIVVSPRVAPGILTLEAWDALRAADRVLSAEDGPHVQGIRSAGIDVEISSDRPPGDGDVVWIAPPGDLQWARDLAESLVGGDEAGLVEIVLGSHDLPGARLLDLVDVMDRLRRECPWTRLQTHESLAPYVLEEAQETFEALESGDTEHLREELGDLLMQVVFHAAVAPRALRTIRTAGTSTTSRPASPPSWCAATRTCSRDGDAPPRPRRSTPSGTASRLPRRRAGIRRPVSRR